jgi:4-amino-4-deoxy-L-arabinose transferase-like glycosyltransferase
MYVSPVFTGLEFLSFKTFGVTLVSARLVSVLAGVIAVVALGLGLKRSAGPVAGVVGAAILAADYMSVMFSRAALLEATMTGFLVVAWWAYAASQRRPWLGVLAGSFTVAAFFTKASAAFFVAALGVEAVLCVAGPLAARGPQWLRAAWPKPAAHRDARSRRAAWFTLLGLAGGGLGVAVTFVWPNLGEYVFYNVKLYGARRSFLSLGPLVDRVSWFPIIHDFFTRNLLVTVLAVAGTLHASWRWRTLTPALRLLVLWFVLGCVELLIHDLGNERRFVFLLPSMVGLAAVALGRFRRGLPGAVAALPRHRVLVAVPLVAYGAYVLLGAVLRVPFVYEVRPAVRLAAAAATVATGLIFATWPRVPAWTARTRWTPGAVVALVALVLAGHLALFVQWSAGRTSRNVAAMRAVGRLLPAGTLVQGKLANGLALENTIRPLYIGVGFGNYADRFQRSDVAYVATYLRPRLGYESPATREFLEALPGWTIVAHLPVAESFGGDDEMVIVRKAGQR